jgi:cellobiose phosphorylase/cellobionic acid phosphorylase
MEYGKFTEDGSRYLITTPKTPNRWFNYLFNDSYYMEVSQTAQGNSQCLENGSRSFTRGYRYFYLYNHNTEECWSPNYKPLKTKLDDYQCTHALAWTEIKSEYKNVESTIKVFVPTQGIQEVWIQKVKNNSEIIQELSVYSVFSFENGEPMGSKCSLDEESQILWSFTFPYHVLYEEKEKMDNKNSFVYMFSDKAISSYDCSEKRFFGGEDTTDVPAAIVNKGCSNKLSEWDNPLGAFEHKITLKPGEEIEFCIVIGCAKSLEEAKSIKKNFVQAESVNRKLEEIESYWENVSNQFKIETPDKNLNNFVNYWLKKQVVLMARNNRLSVYCPVRNQLQDAMGYSMLNPQGAVELALKVIGRQEKSGYIHQWYMTDGSAPKPLCKLKHMDAPIWLVACIAEIVQQCGSLEILDKKVEFKDSDEMATVYEHLLRGVYYLAAQTGQHGLCLMGDGDWTDPINGAGRLGSGESTWSTMGLIYAIRQLLPLAKEIGDKDNVEKLEKIAEQLEVAINDNCWDDNWYVAGFDDNGVAFGKASDEEAKVFLNAQTWAIMSGVAKGERLNKCKEAIESLNTACGPVLLSPAFSKWNSTWGRISIKLAGTTENGSIYCHASMFKAYSDCTAGEGGKAYETIRRTLPTNEENGPEINLQAPIFVPNFYFGLKDSDNFGQSSNNHSTGTAAWMLWVTLEHLLGIKAITAGLEIKPCIPANWSEFSLTRKFKQATYNINVKNPSGVETGVKKIFVNGIELNGKVVPYVEGKEFLVEILMG